MLSERTFTQPTAHPLQKIQDPMKKTSQSLNRAQTTQARRDLIVTSAITCFVENGIAQTGVRDIAKRAGVSLGNLYNHFQGKDALIAEIARLETAGLDEIVENALLTNGKTAGLAAFADAFLDYSADLTQAVLTIEITAMALRNDTIATLFDGNRTMLINCLITLMKRGDITPDINLPASAELILDMIEGMGLRIGLAETAPTDIERQALHAFLRRVI